MRKAKYRIEYKYMYMDENGPVIGVDLRPLNWKARVQKWNYIVNKIINYIVELWAIESFLAASQQHLRSEPEQT